MGKSYSKKIVVAFQCFVSLAVAASPPASPPTSPVSPVPPAGTTAIKAPPVIALSLKEATDLALKQSLRVQKVEAERDGAEAAASKAWGKFYPRIDLTASAGTYHDRVPNPGDLSIPTVARDRNSYIGQAVLTQSLFAGFGDSAQVSAANSARLAKQIKVSSEKNQVTEEVIELYYGIQMLTRQIEAEQEATAFRETQLADVKSRFKAGAATELDRLQADFIVKSQQPILADLNSDLELKILHLARILGLDLDAHLNLTDSLDSANSVLEATKVPSLSEAFKSTLLGNLEMAKLASDIDSYNEESRKIESKHLPKLELQLAIGNNAYLREEITTQAALTYSGQLLLTIPIFSGLESIDERRERAAGFAAMRKERALLRERLLDDLDLAYHTFTLSLSRISSETANVQLAQEAARRARVGLQTGRVSPTDALNYYNQLVQAKKSLAHAMYDRIVSISKIRTILGNRFPVAVSR